MRAGKLDRTITIERPTPTVDDYGTVTDAWMAVEIVRAQLVQSSTEEFIRAFGASSEGVTIFRTRFVSGVTLADRVRFDDRVMDIKEIKEIGRRRGLELRCSGGT